MKNIVAAILLGLPLNLLAAEFTSISLQGRLSSTDTINNVSVWLDGTNLGSTLTLVPDAKGVFSTKFSVSQPDMLSLCSACVISLKKSDGTVLSTSSLRSVPFALTVRGDGPDANLLRASGNVGVGTTNPAYRLDVNGDVRSTGNYYGNGANLSGVLHAEVDPLSVRKAGDTMSGTLSMGSQQITGNGSLTMSTGTFTGNAFSVGKATLTVVNGKVGIGTVSPGASLDVSGNIKITDGTHGQGKVLTSDASGLASWQVPASTFSIGDSYGGGKIFWIDAAGKQVLIAALEDQAVGVRWSNNSNATGAILDGVYAGKANTVLISTMQGAGIYAARICSDYSVTINNEYYDDWYLPSKYELSRLRDNRAIFVEHPLASSLYWSSNEDVNLPSAAWQVYFPTGGLANNFKINPSGAYVRCVRAGPSTSGNLPTNAETVTNGAYITSTQTFTGSNTFKDITATSLTTSSATITGNNGMYGLTVSSNVSLAAALYTANGNIGIGVASPFQKLDVAGTVKATAFQGDGSGLTGFSATDNTKVAKIGDIMTGALQTTTITVTGNAFSVGGSTLVVTNGKVGISSPTPTEALSVEGNVNITGVYKINGVVPAGLGDAILAATQTFTGANTFTGPVAIGKQATQAVEAGIALSTADFGKTITVNSASDRVVTLPLVSVGDIGAQITIMRLGTGKLTIVAGGSATIYESGISDRIYNGSAVEIYLTITLRLAIDTKWVVIGGNSSLTAVPTPFCTVAVDKKKSATVNRAVVFCDNSLKLWTPTIIPDGAVTTKTWGPIQDEPSNSCAGLGAAYPACDYCDTLTYAGYDDWVLPSCASRSAGTGCQLYAFGMDACGWTASGFPQSSCTPAWDTNAQASTKYWSSTEYTADRAWTVTFLNGIVHYSFTKTSTGSVRCVRAGQ